MVDPANHDIVVIGASAGGIPVLLDLVADLPVDLAAAVFVVVHTSPDRHSALAEILNARSPLRAIQPVHRDKIEHGTIYVAPPDNHLQLRPGFVEVVRGPKDNGHRPAVDVLFRTAAASYGSRVIGVVLSGFQNCGTAGMMSIKARGGIAVAQLPHTAVAPEMPRNVIERVEVDYAVHPLELPGLLARLVRTPVPADKAPTSYVQELDGERLGERVGIVCPTCGGAMTVAQHDTFQHFRCHVGHSFTLEALVREQSEDMERILWAAARALEESAALAERVANSQQGELRLRFLEKARLQNQHADSLRHLLLYGTLLTPGDSVETH